MTRKEAWQELKETIIEMRDNDGTGTQQEVCKFLDNYMDVLEKQINEYCEKTLTYLAFDRLRDNIADLLVKSLDKENETTITSLIAVVGIMGMIQDCNEKSDVECVKIINTIKKELKSLYGRNII